MRTTLHGFGGAALAALAALHAPSASAQYSPYGGSGASAYPSTAQTQSASPAPAYSAPAYRPPAQGPPAQSAPANQAPAYQAPTYQAPAYSSAAYGAPPAQASGPAMQSNPYVGALAQTPQARTAQAPTTQAPTTQAPATQGYGQAQSTYPSTNPTTNPYGAAPRTAQNAPPAADYPQASTAAPPVYGYGFSAPQQQQRQQQSASGGSRYGTYGAASSPRVASAPDGVDAQEEKELPGPGEDLPAPAVEEPTFDYDESETESAITEDSSTTPQVVTSAPATADPSGYPGGAGGAWGAAHGYQPTDYNGYFQASGYEHDYSLGAGRPGPKRQWFLGVYGLLMERDRPGNRNVAVLVDGAPDGIYYPQPGDQFLGTSAADPDYQGGAEVRFGSTFGRETSCCGPEFQPWAWEVVFWGLAEDESSAMLLDSFGGTTSLTGLINYDGLTVDGGAANDFFGYQYPLDSDAETDVAVLANRVRQTFKAQNLELNLWRFNASALGYAGGGGAAGACGTGGGKRFFLNGLMGVRYLELDETLQNAAFFTMDDGAGGVVDGEPLAWPGAWDLNSDNVIVHHIDVENELVGFQVGASANYLATPRWTLFSDGNLGIYGNDVSVYQAVSSGGAAATFDSDGSSAVVRSRKEDVAFLGEFRLGMAYQFSNHWRGTLAWRVMAASGVALAVEQIPDNGFGTRADVGYIDSNDSLVLQGLQAGVEAKY